VAGSTRRIVDAVWLLDASTRQSPLLAGPKENVEQFESLRDVAKVWTYPERLILVVGLE
jgi:hypothetical protein